MPIYFSCFITALLLVSGDPNNHNLPQSGRLFILRVIRTSGFPARHWAVLFVFFSPQQTLVELCLTSAVVAVEKWKAFCAFQAQRLFHGHQAAGCSSG